MRIRLSPALTMPAAFAAAVGAFLLADRAPAAGPPPIPAETTTAAANVSDMAEAAEPQLPPNHPPIGSGASLHGTHGGVANVGGSTAEAAEPPGITWKVPTEWTSQPNANAMRLATYRVGDAAELTVVRAGGSTDANIERWVGQFDGPAPSERTEKSVHGLKVTVVHIAGTFVGGGGMTPGASGQSRTGWTMVAAIVESSGSPYFFKLLGPSDQVDRVRTAFDQMLDGIGPRAQ